MKFTGEKYMLKGCKKNVIYIKNTGSAMFDEAYFIVSDRAQGEKRSENDIVREARRIIADAPMTGAPHSAKKSGNTDKKGVNCVAWFMLGACVMTALNAVIFLIM